MSASLRSASTLLKASIPRRGAVSLPAFLRAKALYSTSSVVPYSSYTPRVAIVTGGSQGIGYGIVQRLANDGIDIAVNDVAAKKDLIDEVVEEIRRKGRRAIAVPADVSSEVEVSAMVNKTAKELGSVDIVSPMPNK